jgi:hypothetical protein
MEIQYFISMTKRTLNCRKKANKNNQKNAVCTVTKATIKEGVRVSNCADVSFGLYCKKDVLLIPQSMVNHKSDRILGLRRSKFKNCQSWLVGIRLTNEVADYFLGYCQMIEILS